jgi:segregation and condensation protein A
VSYEVRLDFFEGPLDLLLHLIQKNEVSITDIPIAIITRQYLEAIDYMESLDLDVAGEYLVMAAYLIHIKSQMLLPVDDEEETPLEDLDPRNDLVAHLLEYKRYKEAAQSLDSLLLLDRDVFTRQVFEENQEGIRISQPILADMAELLAALRDVMRGSRRLGSIQVQPDEVLLEDKIDLIVSRLRKGRWLTLLSLLDEDFCRLNVVLTLLAVLDLAKRRVVRIYQDQPFGTILIYPFEPAYAQQTDQWCAASQ